MVYSFYWILVLGWRDEIQVIMLCKLQDTLSCDEYQIAYHRQEKDEGTMDLSHYLYVRAEIFHSTDQRFMYIMMDLCSRFETTFVITTAVRVVEMVVLPLADFLQPTIS